MKARSCPVVLSLALGLALAPAVCTADAAASPYTFVDPGDPAVKEIRLIGERAVDQAAGTMLVEVRRVLASNTPAMAIGILHLKDYKLPPAKPGRPVVTGLRRTSFRVRNPANAPDPADRAALELIREQRDQGEGVAKLLVQRINRTDGPVEWRVYRPLVAMKQCLYCHGSAGSLAPGVHDALNTFYPDDSAVDYEEGDWRGLIRVSIVLAPAGK